MAPLQHCGGKKITKKTNWLFVHIILLLGGAQPGEALQLNQISQLQAHCKTVKKYKQKLSKSVVVK